MFVSCRKNARTYKRGKMKKRFDLSLTPAAILLAAVLPASCTPSKNPQNPQVSFETSLGNFVVELYPDQAPKTVVNFLAYVENGNYTGTIFHRVIKDFVVQGGGMDKDMKEIKTLPPVENEADNGLKNDSGTIAMARTNAPHSASSQFFINLKNNDFLNYQEKSASGWGYCVFGKIVEGMDVIEKMAATEVGNAKGHQDVPKEPIIVKKASLET